MIVYRCAGCGETLETDDALSMQTEKCPVCGHLNTVPKSRKELRRERREQRALRKKTKRAIKEATELKLRQLQHSVHSPRKEGELTGVEPTLGREVRTAKSLVTCKTCGGAVARGLRRCPHCGQKLSSSVPRVVALIIAAVAGLWAIGRLSGDSKWMLDHEATLKSEMRYLNDIEEIAWWEVDGNNVYVGFREVPSHWQWIIRGAALRGNRAINFGCHVWAVKGGAPGWRPGDPGYLGQVTARYGRIR